MLVQRPTHIAESLDLSFATDDVQTLKKECRAKRTTTDFTINARFRFFNADIFEKSNQILIGYSSSNKLSF